MKPGIKTSELWLTVAASVLIGLGAIPVPDKFKWVPIAALTIGYAISRGLAKYESNAELGVFGTDLPHEPVDPVEAERDEQKRETARRLEDPEERRDAMATAARMAEDERAGEEEARERGVTMVPPGGARKQGQPGEGDPPRRLS